MNFVSKILLVLVLLFFTKLTAQDELLNQYSFAKKYFDEEKYFDAITELKRLNFFDEKKQFAYQSNFLIAQSYKAGGKFDEALKYFVLSERFAANEEEYFKSKILQIRTNILRRSTKQAHRLINQLESDDRFESKKTELNYWRGWNYIFEDDWETAAKIFKDVDSTLYTFCNSVEEEKYSVAFAKYSSYLIPGLGQFYTGEYLSGFLSLSWNILFGYLTINAFTEERVFDGLMIGNFLWFRFYTGNLQNAEQFAVDKNLDITNAALFYLQNNFKGEKP